MACSKCGHQSKKNRTGGLSLREAEVISHAITGKPSSEIGEALYICEKTVKFHLTQIYKKLNIKQRPELIAKWYSKKLDADCVAKVNTFLPKEDQVSLVEELTLSRGAT